MLSTHLKQTLTTPLSEVSGFQARFWFILSLSHAVICSSLLLRNAFSSEYSVQTDARQFLFWMWRFLDPELFPNDVIAEYFQSITPSGYAALHQLTATLGIDPLLTNKLLPVVLILLTTTYCFRVSVEILPVPITGFIASFLLNISFLMNSTVSSGIPRAFVYPLLLAFSFYLFRRSILQCITVILLAALFYPTTVFIMIGILIIRLLNWKHGKLEFSKSWKDYQLCVFGLVVSVLGLLPYVLSASEFGPTITINEAREIPDALVRMGFLDTRNWKFWLFNGGSGLFSFFKLLFLWPPLSPLLPPLIFVGFFLPVLLKFPSRFPLARQVTNNIILFPQILLVSFCMFCIAHTQLFKLHFPSRYTSRTFWLVLIMAAAIALTILLDAVFHWVQQQEYPQLFRRQFLVLGAVFLLGSSLILPPIYWKKTGHSPLNEYTNGKIPTVYEFLSKEPKDILIASLSKEVDNIPVLARRSILGGIEYSVAFHIGYYRQIRQRMIDLIHAQYSPDLTEVQNFIHKYGVDFWLLNREEFTLDYLTKNQVSKWSIQLWLRSFQATASEAITALEQGTIPALARTMDHCSVLNIKNYVLVQAKCVAELSEEDVLQKLEL